ncbi:hypothetical protein Cma02nite_27890 [Cellulomonas marina]|nr:hypothetical protein Cma02nite_27890 [Cellulomonas marina]
MHPGQAVADDLVQGGQVNPLRLSEWVADQYDYPLLLRTDDATSVPGTTIGSRAAKGMYVTAARYGTPAVPANSPAYSRIADLIGSARIALGGNPAALPFGVEPTDFAVATEAPWRTFETALTVTESTTTTTPAPPRPVDPVLWKMRRVDEALLERLPAAEAVAVARREDERVLVELPPPEQAVRTVDLADVLVQPVAERVQRTGGLRLEQLGRFRALAPEVASVVPKRVAVADAVPAGVRLHALAGPALARSAVTAAAVGRLRLHDEVVVAEPGPEPDERPVRGVLLDRIRLRDRLAHVELADVREQPTVTQTTTTGTELRVRFSFCSVVVTRIGPTGTRWWNEELLADEDWYVPGLRRGSMVPDVPGDEQGMYLPRQLVLVKDVEITGTWTAEAQAAFDRAAAYVGPFLVQPPAAVTTDGSTTLTVQLVGEGIQVVGELCTPLPVLPPKDDPSLAPAVP